MFKPEGNHDEVVDILNFIVENINSAIFIVNEDFRISRINPAFEEVFQKTEQRVLGELCGNALGCSNLVDEAVDCGKTQNCSSCEIRNSLVESLMHDVPAVRKLLKRDFIIGDTRIEKYFLYTTKRIIFDNSHHIVVIAEDITEFEKTRILLEKRNKELSKLIEEQNSLLGIAAHDLRNPIGAISSMAALLIDDNLKLSTIEVKEMLQLIESTSRHSLNLLNDLLDFSKIEAGKLSLQPMLNDYTDLLNESIIRNRFFFENKQIFLKSSIAADIPMLLFDKGKMHQVLDNLFSNAIKFSNRGSKVYLNVYIEGCEVITEVIDEGVGIEPSSQSGLFTPFYIGNKPTAGERSTGLGLSIVRKIIEGHGGKIAYRPNEGGGSVFWYSLPLS